MSTGQTIPAMFPGLTSSPVDFALASPGSASCVRRLLADAQNIPRYCLKYTVYACALLGLSQVWLARGDGELPPFRQLASESHLAPQRVSASDCMVARTDVNSRRAALEPALAILDEVQPDVAGWVRATDRRKQLMFVDTWSISRGGPGCLARYDSLRGRLTISPGIFAESDGRIATILCHEYRHARQRFSNTLVYALSFLLQPGGDPAIVENDALLFEQDAYYAVFGSHLEP